jgi:hypothetical protein
MMSRIDSRHWKMSTGRHFQNGRHNTTQIQHFYDFNEISYVGRLWCPELIPDIAIFLLVSIFKITTTIPQKIKLRICHNAKCPISSNSTLSDFNAISYVGGLWCPELIPDIEKFSTGRHFQNGRHNTAQIPHCLISTSWIDSRHWKISTGLHFKNGHHNTAKIQHCSISKVAFDLFFKPVVSGQFGRLHNR